MPRPKATLPLLALLPALLLLAGALAEAASGCSVIVGDSLNASLAPGYRVVRGPGWNSSRDEDGGPGRMGTVHLLAEADKAVVMWDNATVGVYRVQDEIRPASPACLPYGESGSDAAARMELRSRVTRGPDWEQGDVNGGPCDLGTVVEAIGADKMVKVKWDNGHEGRYRMGAGGKFELCLAFANCPPGGETGRAAWERLRPGLTVSSWYDRSKPATFLQWESVEDVPEEVMKQLPKGFATRKKWMRIEFDGGEVAHHPLEVGQDVQRYCVTHRPVVDGAINWTTTALPAASTIPERNDSAEAAPLPESGACANGGAVFPGTDTCFCPPGFGGPTCLQACGPDRYGLHCEKRCSGDLQGCRGLQFNSGRYTPLGRKFCHAGWHGPSCSEACPRGKYGADCKVQCGHCAGDAACDPYAGLCPGSCKPTFVEPLCRHELLHLVKGLNISSTDETSFSGTFTISPDNVAGDGFVRSFEVQIRDAAGGPWRRAAEGPLVEPHAAPYHFTVAGLQASTALDVRVLLLDENKASTKDVPYLRVTTSGQRARRQQP